MGQFDLSTPSSSSFSSTGLQLPSFNAPNLSINSSNASFNTPTTSNKYSDLFQINTSPFSNSNPL